jgi:hypothetical protein
MSIDNKSKGKLTKQQLAALSKEEKLQLLDAIAERKRRKRDAREAFIPHSGQLPIITDVHNKRVVVCGNGFGKSALGVNEAMWAADGFNPITKQYTPVPSKVIVLLDAPEKVGDVWLPEMKKWRQIEEEQLHKRGKPYITEVSWPNGSVIRFMFHLQEEMAFESLEADFVVLDEPPPRNVWVALLRSGRKKNSKARFLLIGTPIAQPWLREFHNEWEKGGFPDTCFFRGETAQNRENLAEGYIEEFAAHLTARERATRLEGAFFNSEGMALADLFRADRHLVAESTLPPDYKQAWPHVIAIDPHPNKPLVACLLAAAPNGKRYYVGEYSGKVLPRQFGQWLKQNWLIEHRVIDIVCDNFGSGDYTGGEGFKSAIEVFNSMGLRVRATTYDEKKDDDFLERLQEGLFIPAGGEPQLQMLLTCPGIRRDVENVQWKAQKGTETYQPKLEIGNRDYLACLKYALATNLTFDNSKRKILRTKVTSPWAGNGGPGFMEKRKDSARLGFKRHYARNYHDEDDDD